MYFETVRVTDLGETNYVTSEKAADSLSGTFKDVKFALNSYLDYIFR